MKRNVFDKYRIPNKDSKSILYVRLSITDFRANISAIIKDMKKTDGTVEVIVTNRNQDLLRVSDFQEVKNETPEQKFKRLTAAQYSEIVGDAYLKELKGRMRKESKRREKYQGEDRAMLESNPSAS